MVGRIPRQEPKRDSVHEWLQNRPTHALADSHLERIVESAPVEWQDALRKRYAYVELTPKNDPKGQADKSIRLIKRGTVAYDKWELQQAPESFRAWDRMQAMADFEDKFGAALRFNLSDEEIRDWANKLVFDVEELDAWATVAGVPLHARVDMVRKIARVIGITEEQPIKGEPAIKRAKDPKWWRRRLRSHVARVVEAGFISMGQVHLREGKYVSNAGMTRRRQQVARNAATLQQTLFTNEAGQVYNLGELAALGTSNPLVRGGELMTRIRGAEEYADQRAHVGLFVTLTAPSRFHPITVGGGTPVRNKNYKGATPRDAQLWLRDKWTKTRASLNRQDVRPYGLRVAEPHHDGTPHWHALFWVETEAQAELLEETIRHYWLSDGGDEPGAKQNRVNIKRMVSGGAAGYVAKYISKSVGHHALAEHYDLVDGELIEMRMTAPAPDGQAVQAAISDIAKPEKKAKPEIVNGHLRVDAWAATWGIRQFQTIGMPSVTVWRELRRVTHDQLELFDCEGDSKTVQAYRACHRQGEIKANWCEFMEAMGGHARKRTDWHLAPVRRHVEEGAANKYGEELKCGRLIGLTPQRGRMCGRYLVSRRIAWKPFVQTAESAAAAAVDGPNFEHEEGQAQGVGAAASRQALPAAWTRFNNCTARLDATQNTELLTTRLQELGSLEAAIEAVEFEEGAWL
ncbi:replication endonuclease [Comamonas sediminis]